MSNLVLIVEDNELILFNLKLLLEMQNYQTLTATNGVEALELLKNAKPLPNIIVSDIMMPLMNGYELYNIVSKNEEWSLIPFIFLSAKSSPEDVRFAKKLGIDDYITKPFDEADLLAIIEGKIQKNERIQHLRMQFEYIYKTLSNRETQKREYIDKPSILFLMDWDERFGPYLKCQYSENSQQLNLEEIGLQLYMTSMAFYGNEDYAIADGTVIHMHNYQLDAYIYFDWMQDMKVRGNQRLYMVVALSPSIYYLESLRIRELLHEISELIKKNESSINLKPYWDRLIEIIT